MNIKVIGAIVVLVLLLGGGYMVMSKRTSSPASPTQTGAGNVFSSIKDALSKSLSLECSFTDEQGRQTKSYIKNGAVRADFTGANANESGSVIMKDKKIYFWNAQGGFMMTEPEVTPGAPQQTSSEKTPGNVGDMVSTMEKYKNSCKPSVVSDSLFTPPTNVTFQDFSKMMQGPSGTGGLNAVPSIDYKAYMQGNPPANPQE